MDKEHEDPAVIPEETKYVLFSATDPSPQVFSNTQHTPKEDAQAPLLVPLNLIIQPALYWYWYWLYQKALLEKTYKYIGQYKLFFNYKPLNHLKGKIINKNSPL